MSDGYWGNVQPLQCLNTILIMLEDSNTKLRKVAEDQIILLLRQHKLHKVKALRSYVADFCFAILKNCTRSDYKRSLYIVLFLENGMSLLATGENRPKQYVDILLTLQTCQQAVLTAASLRAIDSYFQSPHYDADTTQTAIVFQTFVESRLQSADMEANTYRYLALASGFVLLHKRDAKLAKSLLKKTCHALMAGCEGEFVQIHDAVGSGFKRLVGECLTSDLVQEALQAQGQRELEKTFLGVIAQSLEELLQIKFKTAWLHVLGACKKLFETITYLKKVTDSSGTLLTPLVRQLAGVYQLVEASSISVDVSTHLAMSETLGSALRCCGFAEFLEIVPLRAAASTPEYMAIDPAREWLLPLFHTNLKLMRCSLCDYAIIILPMVEICKGAVERPADFQLNPSQVALVKARVMQLLSLFPDFCHMGTSDLVSFLPRILPELLGVIKNESKDGMNSAQHILTGIAQLANVVHEGSGGVVYKGAGSGNGSASGGGEQDYSLGELESPEMGALMGVIDFTRIETPEFKALSGHAHSVLPAILAFLERSSIGDPSFASAVRCVSSWTSVAPPSLVTVISKKLLQLLLQATTPSLAVGPMKADAGASWMAITLVVVPYLPPPMVHILYKTIRPLLSVDQSISSQKRAYSVLEAVLTLHAERLFAVESRQSILAVVNESLMNAHVSARNMRLRCIVTIVRSICTNVASANPGTPEHEEAYMRLIEAADATFGEVLICQKDANQKTRESAKAILTLLILHLGLEPSLTRLASAIVAETSVMRSAAVLGFCVAFVQHRSNAGIAQHFPTLFSTACLLLREENAEVSRAVLTFIKVSCAVVPIQALEMQLNNVVMAFCEDLGQLKAKFSSRCKGLMRKLVQRFGEETMRPLIPIEDLPLLEYILRQGRRRERKQGEKEKETDLLQSDDEEDDDDGEDDDGAAMEVAEGTSGKRYSHVGADHRIESRPKAKRSASAVDDKLPASLTDLLEDQGRSTTSSGSGTGGGKMGGSRKRGREETHSTGDAGDEDEQYRVVMEEGVLVIKSRDDDDNMIGSGDKRGKLGAPIRAGDEGLGDVNGDGEGPNKEGSNKKKRVFVPGEEYKSKKSGGDVWRKGTLEPHAYIPLDARLLAGRNNREAMSTFGGVVNTKRARAAAAAAAAPGHVVVGNRKQREARNKRKAGSGAKKK